MAYSNQKNSAFNKKGPRFQDANAPGGRNNPFGGAKAKKPATKPAKSVAAKKQAQEGSET